MAASWWKGKFDPFLITRTAFGFVAAGLTSLFVGPLLASTLAAQVGELLPLVATASVVSLAPVTWAFRNLKKAKQKITWRDPAVVDEFSLDLGTAYQKLVGLLALPFTPLLLYFFPLARTSPSLFSLSAVLLVTAATVSGVLHAGSNIVYEQFALVKMADSIDRQVGVSRSESYRARIDRLATNLAKLEEGIRSLSESLPDLKGLVTSEHHLDIDLIGQHVQAIYMSMVGVELSLSDLEVKAEDVGIEMAADASTAPGVENFEQLSNDLSEHAKSLAKLRVAVVKLNRKTDAFDRLVRADTPVTDGEYRQPSPKPGASQPEPYWAPSSSVSPSKSRAASQRMLN